MLQMPSNDLTLKEFEQLSLGENEMLKSIMSNDKGIKMLTGLSNSQVFMKWLQQNGKLLQRSAITVHKDRQLCSYLYVSDYVLIYACISDVN